MKRLCVCVLYDHEGVIDDYVRCLIKELKKHSNYIIAVCNFERVECGSDNILSEADQVIVRGNNGYDAGAYKDVLVNILSRDFILSFDELLLTNDSYFAPLYPFGEMFDKMNHEKCDFWGITRHYGGMFEDGFRFGEHIQSYFLDFKTKLLHANIFMSFWENYIPTNDRDYTIRQFEIGLNVFLNVHGFIGKAYMDCFGGDFTDEYSVNNPYAMYAYELIKDCRIPIIKKNSLLFDNPGYVNSLMALKYIENNDLFNMNLIKKNLSRIVKSKKGVTSFDFEKMEEFVMSHDKIYLYGNGGWARRLEKYFIYMNWTIDGIIVTERKTKDKNVIEFKELDIKDNDGIIVAQKYASCGRDIYALVITRYKSEQVFLPRYNE